LGASFVSKMNQKEDKKKDHQQNLTPYDIATCMSGGLTIKKFQIRTVNDKNRHNGSSDDW